MGEKPNRRKAGHRKVVDEWIELLADGIPRDIRSNVGLGKMVFFGAPPFLRSKLYHALINRKTRADYDGLKSRCCGYERQIDVDIQRTFRDHPAYSEAYGSGQRMLFNNLVAFANYMPEIGYCQGMSSICGVLLMYFTEAEGFHALVDIIERNNLSSLFDKKLSKLGKVVECQELIFKSAIGDLYSHIKGESVEASAYSYSWYLTLFTRFKSELVLRIWDVFLYHAFPILLYVAAALLKYFKKEIMSKSGESLVMFLVRMERYDIDVDRLSGILRKLLLWSDLDVIRRRLQ